MSRADHELRSVIGRIVAQKWDAGNRIKHVSHWRTSASATRTIRQGEKTPPSISIRSSGLPVSWRPGSTSTSQAARAHPGHVHCR